MGSLTWLITALASLHIGLVFWFGERADVFAYLVDKTYGLTLITWLLWAIGIAGILSLVMFVASLWRHCACGCDKCSCDKACCK
jgi:hypothetical protein